MSKSPPQRRPEWFRPAAWPARARRVAVLAAVAAAGVVGGLGGCADNTERPSPIAELQTPSFARRWATNLQVPDGDQVASLHVRDEHVVMYTTKGRAYLVRRSDGAPVWGAEVPGGSFKLWAPVVLRDRVVFPTTNTLEVYSLANGVHERSVDVRAAIRADCVGERTSVYVPIDSPNGSGRLLRLELENKNRSVPVWELEVWRGGVASAPAVHTDTVFFAADVGTVYSVSTAEREPVWPLPGNVFEARSRVIAPLKVDDVGLYIPCLDGKFYCVHRTSGVVRWQYFAGGPLEQAPVLTGDTVYIFDPVRGWSAVDKVENPEVKGPQYNRKERWARTDVTQVLAQDDQHTYVKDTANRIVALDKRSGVRRFASARSDFHVFGTNARDGIAYTCSRGGRLVAVEPVFQPGRSGEVVRLDDDGRGSVGGATRAILASDVR